MRPDEVRALSREALIERARDLGVARPRTLTHAELADEVIRRITPPGQRRERRGWLGRARDLVATVVERGLSLPEAASLFRNTTRRAPAPPPPLPTVTLAEIYAAQGYYDKAVTVLDEVLQREPQHAEARRLRGRYFLELTVDEQQERGAAPPSVAPPPMPAPPASSAAEEDTDDREELAAESKAEAGAPTVVDVDADPAAYDVDDVVGLAMDAETAFAYWEVRPLTFARAEHRHPGGRLVLRVSTNLGRNGEIETYQRDVPIDELVGDCFVRGLPPGSEVRLGVGYKHPAGFAPFAVAPALQMPRPMATEEPDVMVAPATPPPAPAPSITPAMANRMQRTSPLTWVDFDRPEDGTGEVRRRVVRVETRRGGASDLVHVVHELEERRGGASDLVRGGASELARAGRAIK